MRHPGLGGTVCPCWGLVAPLRGSLIFIFTQGANVRQVRSIILFSEEAKAVHPTRNGKSELGELWPGRNRAESSAEDWGQVFRPHHGAPQGGPSPRQLLADSFSTTRPGAGNPINRSTSLLWQDGHRSPATRVPVSRTSKV